MMYSTLLEQYLFLRSINATKALNFLKLLQSFRHNKKAASGLIRGLPVHLSIEPTTACNLRCPECISGLRNFTRPTGTLNLKIFQQVLQQTKDHLAHIIFYFQGEPYINPNFLDMVAQAREANITTTTSTNGHFLDEERAKRTVESGLDRLIISIDGTTQETYEQYRKEGNLDKVIEGTKNIVAAKKEAKSKTPYIIFQFLVVGPNEHQIPEVYALAKSLGVDRVGLKTAQIEEHQHGHPLMPKNEKYSRYAKGKDGLFHLKNPLEDHCWRMWSGAVITWDGKVVPCCFDKDATYEMGNLQENTFEEIWQGEHYQRFRKQLFNGRANIDMCRNCSEGTKVWAEAASGGY